MNESLQYKETTKSLMLKGARDGFPIGMGYLAVSFALGLAARNAGITPPEGALMSLGMVASAGEYAAILLIGAGAGAVEMITTTLIINLRYFLMSCALTQKLDSSVPMWKRMLLAFCVTDELFGISAAYPGKLKPLYTYSAAVVAVFGWVLGTVLGIIAGNILPARAVSALSVALYGMFIAIIIPPSKKSRFMMGLIVLSMLLSLLFTLIPVLNSISSGFKVILLTVAVAGGAAVIRPIPDEDEETNAKEAV